MCACVSMYACVCVCVCVSWFAWWGSNFVHNSSSSSSSSFVSLSTEAAVDVGVLRLNKLEALNKWGGQCRFRFVIFYQEPPRWHNTNTRARARLFLTQKLPSWRNFSITLSSKLQTRDQQESSSTHAHTYTYTRTHTHMYTYTHTRTHTCIHPRVHAHTHKYMYTHTHTHARTHTCAVSAVLYIAYCI